MMIQQKNMQILHRLKENTVKALYTMVMESEYVQVFKLKNSLTDGTLKDTKTQKIRPLAIGNQLDQLKCKTQQRLTLQDTWLERQKEGIMKLSKINLKRSLTRILRYHTSQYIRQGYHHGCGSLQTIRHTTSSGTQIRKNSERSHSQWPQWPQSYTQEIRTWSRN